jgi:DNA-binding NtrC family response regulator
VAVGSPREAQRLLARGTFDVLLVDNLMPELTGLDLIRELVSTTAVADRPQILLMTAHATVESAIEAMKLGALDYLQKPFEIDELLVVVNRALDHQRLRTQHGYLLSERAEEFNQYGIVGRSRGVLDVIRTAEMVAKSRSTVLVTGDTGTGKELVARAIHFHSAQRDMPLVKVNCAAIPENLLESELFGHVRGAFTGALTTKKGKFALADGGTIFLDEIATMAPPLQSKLLRVLQSHEFRRIGDDTDRHADVRVITATNRDLDQLVARGSFRQDLYYRINVFPMHLPPLRERPEDIPLLVHHFLHKYRARLGKAIDAVSPRALARFRTYDFPGNVRELENKVHQAMVVAGGPTIDEADVALPASRVTTGAIDVSRPFREIKQEAIDAFERAYLTELLRTHRGNLAQAARAAGMDRKNLWTLVERHGLDRGQFKKP